MNVYLVIVTTILLLAVALGGVAGYLGYLYLEAQISEKQTEIDDLQSQVSSNLKVEQHNSHILQEEVKDLYKGVRTIISVLAGASEDGPSPSNFTKSFDSTH